MCIAKLMFNCRHPTLAGGIRTVQRRDFGEIESKSVTLYFPVTSYENVPVLTSETLRIQVLSEDEELTV